MFQVISPIFSPDEELPSPPPSPLKDHRIDDEVKTKDEQLPNLQIIVIVPRLFEDIIVGTMMTDYDADGL